MFSLSCKTWLRRTCSLFRLPEIKMNLSGMNLRDFGDSGRWFVDFKFYPIIKLLDTDLADEAAAAKWWIISYHIPGGSETT